MSEARAGGVRVGRRGFAEGLLASAVASFGCGRRDDASATSLSVFAASSLTEAFRDLEVLFEAEHPAIDVQLTFAGSQILRMQIEQGAVADVFASADEQHMEALAEAGLVAGARTFARNELVIIVSADNPAGLHTFDDLPKARRLVVGVDNVPVGRYARLMLDSARQDRGEGFAAIVRGNIVSQEHNVRLVRAKVELGEADAAIVYRTDAVASNAVRAIDIPPELNVQARYRIGRVVRSEHADAAERFIAFLDSEPARRTLRRHGFSAGSP